MVSGSVKLLGDFAYIRMPISADYFDTSLTAITTHWQLTCSRVDEHAAFV